MSVFYRITNGFLGQHTVFQPTFVYEQVRKVEAQFLLMEEDCSTKVKEVCFSKSVPGCLFGINMFLEEGFYYIYQTNREPYIDLSDCPIGDFSAIQEVRYNVPVEAKYVGKLEVTDFLIHSLQSLYEQSTWGESFDNSYATKGLESYHVLNDRIIV